MTSVAYQLPPDVREISIKPYPGRMFYAKTRKGYEQAHKTIFDHEDKLNKMQGGRFSFDEGRDKIGTFLVWAKDRPRIVHECCHVALEIFNDIKAHPYECGNEPFAYFVQHLYHQITNTETP